jgi:hypothetical protein
MAIHFILLQNRVGKTRLAKWYDSYSDEDKESAKIEVHRIITSRDPTFTNFVEVKKILIKSTKKIKLFIKDMRGYIFPFVLI